MKNKLLKIIVTGGAGFIGSHIVDAYIKAGHKVVVIDDLSSGKRKNLNPKAKFYQANICNQKKIDQIFAREKPDILNHHAAQKNVRFSVDNPVFDAKINILGGLNLLEASRKYGVKKIIFASSGGAIYGDCENIPTPEKQLELPISPYGVAKLALEKYLHYYFVQYKIPYISLRYANVYGPRQDPRGEAGVVAIFCQNIINNKKSKIFGDGRQTRDFVYVKDVARANLLALRKKSQGVYNIGIAKETNINNLYKILADIQSSSLKPSQMPAKLGEQKRSCLSYYKAKKILGWKPEYNLKKGLKKTLASFEQK